ncbi:hypothetical protein DAPPUDRAFT_110115 [Daphnia pulex]|uniref:OB domain-containing protein n=1 Tax=Daphnia pulex TaxID=6669 RepID=E9H595_DAPPU|nr:hypothetical protein DAPPUDRAFT_110115 [Daphnia pulex]|eukprot:EFX73090.1 hypothetical protein DAPPUDRAFT_110115 [Daphnia pulex]
MDHQLLLNPAKERYTMSSAQKSESEGDVVECPGMENNSVLLPGGNNQVIELSPVKKEAETTLVSLERKRSSTEMGEMSTVSKTSGGSSGPESSPAKKKMEAMKNKCPNAGLTNQVVDIASLFLQNPSCKLAARLVLIVVKDVFFGGKLQQIMELTFLDRSGEIKVTVWSNLIEKWSGVLKKNDVYLLSGLVFVKADRKYTRTSPGVVEAKFNNYTQCIFISESDLAQYDIPRLQFHFKDFNSLITESKLGDVIDVIGLLTEVCDLDFKEKGNEKLLILMNRDTEQKESNIKFYL